MKDMQEQNGISTSLRASTTEKASGGAFSLACVFPTILAVFVMAVLGALGLLTDGYENTDWWAYVSFLITPIAFGVVVVLYLRYQKISLKTAVLSQKCHSKYLFWAVILQVGLFALSQINSTFLTWLEQFGYQAEDIVLPSLDGFGLVGAIFSVAVLPAVAEELIFRGTLLHGLKKNFSTWAAVLICGGMFAIYHQRPEQTIYQFCCGAAYALLALRSGSVLPTILAHFLNNATIIILYANGITSFTLPVFWTIIAVSSVCLLTALGYLIFIDKNKPCVNEKPQRKHFFIYAGIGLFIVTCSWFITLFSGLL